MDKILQFFKTTIKYSFLITFCYLTACLFFQRTPDELLLVGVANSTGEQATAASVISLSILLPSFYVVGAILPESTSVLGITVLGIVFHMPPLQTRLFVDAGTSSFLRKMAYMLLLLIEAATINFKTLKKENLNRLLPMTGLVVFELSLLFCYSFWCLDFGVLSALSYGWWTFVENQEKASASVLLAQSPILLVPWVRGIVANEAPSHFFGVGGHLEGVLTMPALLTEMISIILFGTTIRLLKDIPCVLSVLIPLPFEIFFAFVGGGLFGCLIYLLSRREPRVRPAHGELPVLRAPAPVMNADEAQILRSRMVVLGLTIIVMSTLALISGSEYLGCEVFGPIAVWNFGFTTRLFMTKRWRKTFPLILTQLKTFWKSVFKPLLFGLIGFRIDPVRVYQLGMEKKVLCLLIVSVPIGMALYRTFARSILGRLPFFDVTKRSSKRREVLYSSLSPRGTIQAALGSAYLEMSLNKGSPEMIAIGEWIEISAVLLIICTSTSSIFSIPCYAANRIERQRLQREIDRYVRKRKRQRRRPPRLPHYVQHEHARTRGEAEECLELVDLSRARTDSSSCPSTMTEILSITSSQSRRLNSESEMNRTAEEELIETVSMPQFLDHLAKEQDNIDRLLIEYQ